MCNCTDKSGAFAQPVTRRSLLGGVGIVAGGALAMLARPGLTWAAPQWQAAPELLPLGADAYLWRDSGYNKFFLVTADGVIATDPSAETNPALADRYKAAIGSVTDRPVRYLVYSHHHADHSVGGDVFADTAQFVAHRLAAPQIAARNDPRNPVPTILFDDTLHLDLGGKAIDLTYTGRNHTDNSLVLQYPAARLIFAVDFIPVGGLPFRNFPDGYPDELIDSLAWIEANLDFDVLAPGHGNLGTKDTVREDRVYLLELMAAIRDARARGLPDNSEAMVNMVRAALAPRYGTWSQFGPWLPENIEGLTRLGFTR
jgi:glyoxylase-like metal-dependent hydrolase (beta-lactamase superfamily II)